MSEYAHFFLRHNDEFIPLGTYSRSTFTFETVHRYAPWEKIRVITTQVLDNFIEETKDYIQECEKRRQNYEQRKQLIATFNNSIDEKMEVIHDCDESIEELTDLINEAVDTRALLWFFRYRMIPASDNPNNRLYVGLEISKPTMEDIVNDATR